MAETDEMTYYGYRSPERCIEKFLRKNKDAKYSFFIFDDDNFKQANDQSMGMFLWYGH